MASMNRSNSRLDICGQGSPRVTWKAEAACQYVFNLQCAGPNSATVGDRRLDGNGSLIYGKAVILAGNHHHTGCPDLDRVVGTVVPVAPSFAVLATGSQRPATDGQGLDAEQHPECRFPALQDRLNRMNRRAPDHLGPFARNTPSAANGQHLDGRRLRGYIQSGGSRAADQHVAKCCTSTRNRRRPRVGQISMGDFRMLVPVSSSRRWSANW